MGREDVSETRLVSPSMVLVAPCSMMRSGTPSLCIRNMGQNRNPPRKEGGLYSEGGFGLSGLVGGGRDPDDLGFRRIPRS
jgi:hypothetical protein